MNSESEAVNHLLAWLLQDPNPTVSTPSGETSSQGTDPDESGAGDPLLHYLDSLDFEEVGLPPASGELNHFSVEENLFFELGDNLAVQERFHALLKRRLRVEIERNPPRFPWETEAYHYESETEDSVAPSLVPAKLWAAQLQNLNLPIALPEAVLASLFEQCQVVVQSSLREGAKLVQAVESLFPGQSQALNHLAGLVLASPARSGATAQASRPLAGFPSDYEAATPAQQMALSLLAAREIIDTLTLTVSSNQPKADRQWLTTAGRLTLETEYQPQNGRLRIQAQFPCQGSLRLHGREAHSTAQRSDAGYLSVELFDLEPSQHYPLEVQLVAPNQPPLIFNVHPIVVSDR